MAKYQRIERQQALREAQGYLELAMGLTDQWPVPAALSERLAQRALDALATVTDFGVQRTEVLYLTGLAYRTMQRYAEAVPPLQAAAQREPDSAPIWLVLGWCYNRIARLEAAIAALERAMETNSQEAILHYNLACYWSLAGNVERAVQYLAQSFEIDPRYRELVASESDFDPIRDLPGFQSLMGAIV